MSAPRLRSSRTSRLSTEVLVAGAHRDGQAARVEEGDAFESPDLADHGERGARGLAAERSLGAPRCSPRRVTLTNQPLGESEVSPPTMATPWGEAACLMPS